jgi:hypothetical protein
MIACSVWLYGSLLMLLPWLLVAYIIYQDFKSS